MPLDDMHDHDDDEAFEHALEVAKAALQMIALALEDDVQLIAVLGAMTELALKRYVEADDQRHMTAMFVDTLREHMARPH